VDPYERAVHAVLCGRWREALPVCETWEDEAWVRVTTAMDARVTWAVEFCLGGADGYDTEVEDDDEMLDDDVPAGLEALPTLGEVLPEPRDRAATETLERLRTAQIMILRGQETELADHLAAWCAADAAAADSARAGGLPNNLNVTSTSSTVAGGVNGGGFGASGYGGGFGGLGGGGSSSSAAAQPRSLMTAAFTAPPPPPQLTVRFAAHYLLFLESLGMDGISANAVVGAYTEALSRRRRAGLVATYAARLAPADALAAFSAFLATVGDAQERERCLEMGRAAGVEVRGVAAEVVRRIWQQGLRV
jgi:hypothetical protein